MKINTANTDKINAAIKAAEGRATARTITANDIGAEIIRLNRWLDANSVPLKVRAGLTFCVDPNAQSFPSSYQYTPESTQIRLTIGADGKTYFLTRVGRGICTPGTASLVFSSEARAALEAAIVKHAYGELR